MTAEEKKDSFLSDTPIESIDQDEFRHKEYVDTLEEMVKEADPPWNIGVFGEWGSGKTSVIRMLYSRLEEKDADYVTVEFDAWKHAEESIRTDLLLNLDRAIGEATGDGTDDEPGVLGEDQITRKLYDVEEEQEDDDLSAWEEAERIYTESPLVGRATLLILLVILVGAIVNLFTILGLLQITDTTLSSINSILTAFLFPLFISVFIFMAGEVRRATTALRQKHPRKEWSGAFEKLFDEILAQTDVDRILISVDNLDRCESETVYDVLVSLKTFLENERCIYIIPCDDQALQSHIESIDEEGKYFEEQANAREFLRKFFQAHIRIPKFIPEDIEQYAKTKNQELADPFDNDVLDVITKAYVQNPRRIKQSLNQLSTLRILAKQMEEEGHIMDGRLTDNLDFLAKIMVLEEDHPTFYQELQEDPRLLEDVNEYFRSDLANTNRASKVERILEKDEDSLKGESRLETFLKATRRTRADNPRPFLRLGEPSFYTELGDADTFIQNLWTNQEQEVREEIRTVQEESQSVAPYIEAISSRLRDYSSEGRNNRLFSTIDTLVAVFDEFEDENQRRVAEVLGEYLTLNQVQDFYSDFNPEEFFPVLLKIPADDRETIFDRFAEVVVDSNERLRKNVLESFVEYAEEVPGPTASKLCKTLLRLNTDSLEQALEILSRTEASKNLATPELLEPAANRVVWNDNRNRFNETDHYKQFDSQAEPRSRTFYVERLLDLQKEVDDNQENQYYNSLRQELEQLDGQVKLDTGTRLFNELKQQVNNSSGQPVHRVKVAVNFYESYDPDTKKKFQDWIADLLTRWDEGNIQKIIRHAEDQNVEILKDETVVEGVLSRVPDTLGNENFITDSLILSIPSKYDDQIIQLVKRLSESNNHTENQLAAKIFAGNPKRLEEVQEIVLEQCRDQIDSTNNVDHKKAYLSAEAAVYGQLDDSEKEGFINDRLSSLLSGNHQEHQAFQEIWKEVGEQMGAKRRTIVARNLRDQLQSELGGTVQWNQLNPLLSVVQSLAETDDIEVDNGEWTVERLSRQFKGSNLNNRQVSNLIDQLSEFPKYYGNEEQVLDRVESLISNNNSNRIRKSAKQLIESLEQMEEVEEERIEKVKEKIES